MILVRTPSHKETESLLGYVVRVSETNGYESPWNILNRLGIAQGAMSSAGFPTRTFAPILGRAPDALDDIAYSLPESGDRGFKILSHSLGSGLRYRPLRLKHPAACPDCISEKGFAEAFFDLRIAVACPIHGKEVLFRCDACRNPLSMFRPGVLVCQCGASLAESSRRPASEQTVALMAVLKAKLEGTRMTDPAPAGLPAQALLAMPLRVLLQHLPKFAAFNRKGVHEDSPEIADGIAQALANWPRGFHEFLNDLSRTEQTVVFRRRYGAFLDQFFSSQEARKEFNWLHEEFLQFGLTYANDSIVDARFAPAKTTERRFISLTELSKRTGLDRRTLESWNRKGILPLQRVGSGSSTRYIADAREIRLPHNLQKADLLGERAAAAYLQIPVSTLSRLKGTGNYEVQHHTSFSRGYHRADLRAFLDRLLALSPPIKRRHLQRTAISLHHILVTFKLRSSDQKMQILVAYLNGDLRSMGRTGDTTADIMFDPQHVAALVSAGHAVASSEILTKQQAALVIGCDSMTIHGLLARGLIKKSATGQERQIDAGSVERFRQDYVALARCASRWKTSSARLKRLCKQTRIRLIQVPYGDGGNAGFIRQSAIDTLRSAMDDEDTQKRYRRRNQNSPTQAISSLHRYIQNLAQNNEPLPRRFGRPNKRAIALACGVTRDFFYTNSDAMRILEKFALQEQELLAAQGYIVKPPLARLGDYLEQLRKSGTPLPRRAGRVNKLAVARNCGINRSVLHDDAKAAKMLATYEKHDKIR
jgi:hypothetical protein